MEICLLLKFTKKKEQRSGNGGTNDGCKYFFWALVY